ncbi:MAG: hypothetical protein PHI37_02360 [Candidatus Gracilibacteria bacterium]|nr:hypothetical protein [Candidatus Gracilibacteria bacterium]
MKKIKNYVLDVFKTTFLIGVLLIGSIYIVYAINWPSSVPGGEVVGGVYNKYFDNMKGDCPTNQAVYGFDQDLSKKCKNISVPPLIVNGSCGSSNGTTVSTSPTTNLCDSGTASAISGTGPWTWTCDGSGGGTNADCSANKIDAGGECILDATLDCVLGGETTPQVNYTYSWDSGDWSNCNVSCGGGYKTRIVSCLRNDGVIVDDKNCTGTKPITSDTCNTNTCGVNGTCGTANGAKLQTLSSAQLCATGIASQATGPTNVNNVWKWDWTCYGTGGGTNASCSAEFVTYNFATTQAASAHGGSKTTLLGNHKHCVISRVYGDLEYSAWYLSKSTQDNTSICMTYGRGFEDGTIKYMCTSWATVNAGDWYVRMDDEGSRQVAYGDVLCTDELPGQGGSTTGGALCTHNSLTGIVDGNGCCIIGSSATGDRASRITGDFWNSCNP